MATVVHDPEALKRALAAGQITVPDSATGYQRSMYADCPNDGQAAGICRVVREHGGEITAVTMRCSTCGTEFSAPVESLYLR
jgi:hypothetical protein